MLEIKSFKLDIRQDYLLALGKVCKYVNLTGLYCEYETYEEFRSINFHRGDKAMFYSCEWDKEEPPTVAEVEGIIYKYVQNKYVQVQIEASVLKEIFDTINISENNK